MSTPMHMRVVFIFVMLLQVATASGAHKCPLTNVNRVWSGKCFDTTRAVRTVKKEFRKNLVIGRERSTSVVISNPPELVTILRNGTVLRHRYGQVLEFDFEPTDGETGRFGYLAKDANNETISKCGYYERAPFRVLVPPIYDQCKSFKDGHALVCIGCTSQCDSGDCHDSDFVGGQGYIINDKNEVLEEVELPALPLCSSKGSPIRAGINCRVPLEQ
ncbi:hypothetical protein KY495_16005 [Massilia sp. PAMC28688]|uniref:hypothetical protein n=1 Tax=Massilia sp. PAMC28688 TaxID=2861283 RepID=UPI001C625465|nr:hypothetical protein [Massilia sp. PAMC28688]QYF92254.1 hypothetical protein KY495_16005 [Massilia sp. PAMC28688]